MVSRKYLETLLVVDDLEGNLDCIKKSIEQIQKEGYLQNCGIEYYNGFDQGLSRLSKIAESEYSGVITDLFEGTDNPKGLKIVIECLNRGIECGVLTDGDRHSKELGTVRYYLDVGSLDHCKYPKEEVVENLQKLGIKMGALMGIGKGFTFWSEILIGQNGLSDKQSVAKVTRRLKEYFGIPHLDEGQLMKKIEEKLPENESLSSYPGEIKGISDYFVIETKICEEEGKNSKLYLVKEKNCKVFLRELDKIKGQKSFFPQFRVDGKDLTIKTFQDKTIETKLEFPYNYNWL